MQKWLSYYFETGCKENCILRKTTVKFIILIFGIFEKNLLHLKTITLNVWWLPQLQADAAEARSLLQVLK